MPLESFGAVRERLPSSLAKTQCQGMDMKLTRIKNRIATGSVALALAAGGAWVAPAAEPAGTPALERHDNIFLGEVPGAKYLQTSATTGVVGEVELVRERYTDGKVRVERQVTLDKEGNYVNHGAWKLFSKEGDVIAEGQYNFGERVGMWTRWIGRTDSTSSLNDQPFKSFKTPFMSQASFTNDKMDGEWTITDANDRKMLTVTLKNGERDGVTTMWLPNGSIYRQMTYEHDVPVGDVLEPNPKKNGEVGKAATYDNGRKIVTKTEYYPRGSKQLKSEVMYLAAKTVKQSADDYWATTLAKFAPEGEDLRHGSIKLWYANGQAQQEGFYDHGKKTGVFTYWHENGQISTTGEYRDDQPVGDWVWYHDNGQKSAIGRYEQGKLMGEWRFWDAEGKLTKRQTYNGTESASNPADERTDVAKHVAKGSRQLD